MHLRVLNYKIPLQCLTGEMSYVVAPKIFWCACFVHDYQPLVEKLDPKALKFVFFGYSSRQKGYKCWRLSEKKLFVSMDLTFGH